MLRKSQQPPGTQAQAAPVLTGQAGLKECYLGAAPNNLVEVSDPVSFLSTCLRSLSGDQPI